MLTARVAGPIIACALALVGVSGRVAAQSANDLAAFNALIVSPVGALPPSAIDDGHPLPDRASLLMSYGRWRYDINDAIHENVGLTVRHRLASSRTSVSVTGAYLSASCDCSGWSSAGVSINSIAWSTMPSRGMNTRTAARLSLELMAGGARFLGAGHATAYSFATAIDVGGSVRVGGSSRLAFSLIPGIGYGHLKSVDEKGGGTRPLLGAAASWMFARGISLHVGARRIALPGGPTQLGGGISWHRR